MDTATIILLSQAIGSLLVLGVQKYLLGGLQTTIGNLKTTIETQNSAITALKTQADGQVGITARLEAIVDRTERHATTVLTNHEKLVQLVEDRAAREKQEVEDRAEREKQKSEALLEDARGQLIARKETIKGAVMQPEIASLLTSLSQENFATKEVLTSLKADINQFIASNNRIHTSEIFNTQKYSASDIPNFYPTILEIAKEKYEYYKINHWSMPMGALIDAIIDEFLMIELAKSSAPQKFSQMSSLASMQHSIRESVKSVITSLKPEFTGIESMMIGQ